MRGSKNFIHKSKQLVWNTLFSGMVTMVTMLLVLGLTGCNPSPQDLLSEGEALLARGDYGEAARKLEKAAAGLPDNANVWNKLGLAWQYEGKFLSAREAYERAQNIDPTFPDIYFNLGNLFLDNNQLPEAISNLQKYTFMVQDSVQGFLTLAMAQRRAGQFDDAMTNLNRARSIGEEEVTVLNEMALTLYQKGEAAEALQYLTYINAEYPDFAPAVLNMAIISQNTANNKSYAIQLYRQYLEMNPPEDKAERVREIIQRIENDLVASENQTLPPIESIVNEDEQDPTDDQTAENESATGSGPTSTNQSTAELEIPEMDFVTSDESPGLLSPDRTGKTDDQADGDDSPDVASIREPREVPEPPEEALMPGEEADVSTAELPEPDLEVVAGDEFSRPPVPRNYGVTQNFNGRNIFIVPVTPEPVPVEPPDPTEAGFRYPYEDIRRLLDANRDVLRAYGLTAASPPEGVDIYRNNPVPQGVTPLEPLAPVNEEALNRVRTIGSPDYIQDELTNPEVDLGQLSAPEAPKRYAIVDPDQTTEVEAEADTPSGQNPLPGYPPPSPARNERPTLNPQSAGQFPRYEYLSPAEPQPGDRLLAKGYFEDGVKAYQAGRSDYAIDFFSRAVQQDPAYYEAWYNLGIIQLKTRQNEQALESLENAMALRPENIELHYHMGQALMNAGYVADAVNEFSQVLDVKPDHLGAHFALAKLFDQSVGNRDNAGFHYRRILEIAPSHPQSTNIRYWLRNSLQ